MAISAEPGRKTAYAAELHWRVVWQRIGMGLTFRKIAENLSIACSTAQAIYKLLKQAGGLNPWTHMSLGGPVLHQYRAIRPISDQAGY